MRLAALATLALLTLSAAPARADGFYCGNDLVRTGESDTGVLARCGPPDSRAPVREVQCLTWGICQSVEIGERWTYDLGPQRLVRHLVFRAQKLETIETGGYGRAR